MRLPMLLGIRAEHRRGNLQRVLRVGQRRSGLLRVVMAAPTVSARRVAVRVWTRRLHVERDAAARFGRLGGELVAVGAADEVVALAERAAADERRHAALCEELIEHFGGDAPAATEATLGAPVGPKEAEPRQRTAYEMVAMSCLTETLSTALLGALVERADEDRVRDIMREILRDEVQHSRLGWAHLAAEHREGASVAWIGAYLPAMLRATVRDELFDSGDEHAEQEALSGMGSLSRAERLDVFVQCMQRVVFPGLRQFGIDSSAGARWLDARLLGTR
jgi:hypothetical protein